MSRPIFRFAPSPNGYLHPGHAYAALLNQKICRAHNGIMLLRMENTDIGRSNRKYEDAILEDLTWIGFEWQGEVRRQSEYFDRYQTKLDELRNAGFAYPSFLSRREIRGVVEKWEKDNDNDWPRDPDGALHYPGIGREFDEATRIRLQAENPNFAMRLDINAAIGNNPNDLNWQEMQCDDNGAELKQERIKCAPEQWGDVILGRKDIPASYHLACVIDDGLQNITHVVRGKDIYHATSIHRVLQKLLGIEPPIYCHHDLLLDDQGEKLSKRHGDKSLRELREEGMLPSDIHRLIGLTP